MKADKIRSIAICIFLNNGAILASEGRDEVKHERFYRPLGGAIEFGEMSVDTVRRELREEIDAEVKSLRCLGTLENIFTYNGEAGHEIVIVYDGELVDANFYMINPIFGWENGGLKIRAYWMPLDAFRSGKEILYPTGLLELIDQNRGS
jgi:ADP-ribose pyrophosphatase YjhB (NUDIX family)